MSSNLSWRDVLYTTSCDKVCQWLVTGRWFSPVSSTNKTDHHDIIEILLKVALITINQPTNQYSSLKQFFWVLDLPINGIVTVNFFDKINFFRPERCSIKQFVSGTRNMGCISSSIQWCLFLSIIFCKEFVKIHISTFRY